MYSMPSSDSHLLLSEFWWCWQFYTKPCFPQLGTLLILQRLCKGLIVMRTGAMDPGLVEKHARHEQGCGGGGASPTCFSFKETCSVSKVPDNGKQSGQWLWIAEKASSTAIHLRSLSLGLLLWLCVHKPGLYEMSKVQNLRRHSLSGAHFAVITQRKCTLKCSWNNSLATPLSQTLCQSLSGWKMACFLNCAGAQYLSLTWKPPLGWPFNN